MSKLIPLSVPNLKGNELKYVTKAITEEWVSTAGAYITDFEKAISNYLRVDNAVACQSGTAGLHLALQVCGVGRNDEVLVPTLTFIAAVNPVRYLGAEPVFMDCDDSLTMDVDKLEDFLLKECDTNKGKVVNKKTNRQIKAIVVVHVFGNLANMEKIMELSQQYRIPVVEDATEALGSYYLSGSYAGKYAGTIGTVGVYSFNGNKVITTGGGGMIVANVPEYLQRCRSLSTQAKRDELYFEHSEVGYNYRMTNLQAALGLAQMEQLEHFIEVKKENYRRYITDGIELLPFSDNIRSNYWFYSYMTTKRDELIQYLKQHEIQSRPVWKLIHTADMYKENQAYKIEKALYYYERIVNLPCSSNLQPEDVDFVVDKIRQFAK
ncbi:MAG: LegC family aminotransferase [Lachnospiraceae bacterium]|nr:LegC family aminotransferase [Lachnospiraceae bacterium]MCM1237853.1 LegC family aminotransferase [Lachnospiraceae bacterium]